jgi:hypothetical protein
VADGFKLWPECIIRQHVTLKINMGEKHGFIITKPIQEMATLSAEFSTGFEIMRYLPKKAINFHCYASV